MADTPDLFGFGPGDLVLAPKTGTDLTPVMFNLQGFDVEYKFDNKSLFGRNQFPLVVARGKGSITTKMQNATVNGASFNRVFFGAAAQVSTAGQLKTAMREVLVFAGGATTTTAVANAGFKMDLGAIRVDVATPLTKLNTAPVAPATPAEGTYWCDGAGNYSFNAANVAGGLVANYTFMTAAGSTTTINNVPMGTGPQCLLLYTTNFQGSQVTMQLNMVQATGLKMAFKLDDFMIPEQDVAAFADITNTVGMMSYGA